jgi:hypothetical protein
MAANLSIAPLPAASAAPGANGGPIFMGEGIDTRSHFRGTRGDGDNSDYRVASIYPVNRDIPSFSRKEAALNQSKPIASNSGVKQVIPGILLVRIMSALPASRCPREPID